MSKMEENKSMKYFSLSPASNLEAPIYFEALDEKLQDDTIRNIAITGSHGSGKSSILESYFTQRKVKKYLKVSLANFCESNSEITPEDEKIIEEQILQQLFYQLPHDSIPFSRFKKISHIDDRSQQKLIVSIILWLFSVFFIPNILKLINQNIQSISSIGIKEFFYQISWFGTSINILTLAVFSAGLFYIFKKIVCVLQKGHLKKIAMKSANIELSEDSALNNHIDEIIYFFEATDKAIVIIEDLDRFNSITLFSKLREVNFLINNSPKVGQVVKFIYAIRDEVFTDNLNRTKFFDFILPIVPVINTTNSGDKLRDYLNNDKTIPHAYINDISLYIHDLRLLKNIVNEYNIYSGVINENQKRRSVSLFSLILYKNLFPSEFGLEHSEKGFLYKIFKEKKFELLNILAAEYITKIDELTAEKKSKNTAHSLNGEKLREEYIMEILKSNSNVISICNHTINAISLDNDNFIALLTNPQVQVYENYYNRIRVHNFNFEEIQKRVNPNFTYEERLELVERKQDGVLKELDGQITKIKSDVATLQRKKLVGLIKQYQDNKWRNILFGNKENGLSSEEELLALLLRKGYIDENYQLYMSYFYVGALSLGDFEFLLNVKNNEGDNFKTELTNVNELFSRISEDEYEYEATLNKELIFNLLKRLNYKEDKRLELLLLQFKYLESSFEKYIQPLFERLRTHKRELQRFIELLVEKYYPTIWQSIDNQNYDDNIKDEFLKLFLFLPEGLIKSLNESSDNESLKNYLAKKENFIEVFNSPDLVGDITKLIKTLNIKFKKLEFKRYENNQVFNYICQNDNYTLNREMLYLMLFHKYNLSESEYNKLFYNQNYTSIIQSTDDVLNSNVILNYDIYLKDIYLKLEEEQAESEDAISSFVELLEAEKDTDLLFSVLTKVSTLIKDIEQFGNKEKWTLFFDTDCVDPNWKNLIAYFKNKESSMNRTITKWLCSPKVVDSLTMNNLSKEHFAEEDKDLISLFMQQIIENDKLNHASYERLLFSFPYIFNKITLNELSSNKISQLIELRKIKYNTHHYNQLRSLDLPLELFLFTIHNISKFVGDYNDYEFDLELHKRLLEYREVGLSIKKSIIKLISIENIKDSKLSSLIGTILFTSKEELVGNDKIIAVIYNCTNLDLKLQVFDKYLENFEFNEIDKLLENIGGVYKKASKLRKRPPWKNNTINQSIAKKLTEIEYFKSYYIDKEKNEIKIVVRYN